MKTHAAKYNKAYYYIYALQHLMKNIGVYSRTVDILEGISSKLPEGSPVMSTRQMQRILGCMRDMGVIANNPNYGWYITEEGLKGFGYDKYGDVEK